jgi:phosphonopyruvate decarboxylase
MTSRWLKKYTSMIKDTELSQCLAQNGFRFLTGVPCSIFKDFISCLGQENNTGIKHIVSACEGEAIGLATGYHLASGGFPVVYMQNSGLANALDSLTSLVNKEVYGIPILLLVSWRGEPGKKEAAQHVKMGQITLDTLKLLDIPAEILSENINTARGQIVQASAYLKKNRLPYALVVRKGIISPSAEIGKEAGKLPLSREEALKIIIENTKGGEAVVSTTGKTTRELFECRQAKGQDHRSDFYNLGSMGCCAGIALGAALESPNKKFLVFDGDGAVLMRMGTLATVGHYKPANYYHVVFDNEAYDSTGGQPTASSTVDFGGVAVACGYRQAFKAASKEELVSALAAMNSQSGPAMLVVKIRTGARADLGRPTISPAEKKKTFMEFMQI